MHSKFKMILDVSLTTELLHILSCRTIVAIVVRDLTLDQSIVINVIVETPALQSTGNNRLLI